MENYPALSGLVVLGRVTQGYARWGRLHLGLEYGGPLALQKVAVSW